MKWMSSRLAVLVFSVVLSSFAAAQTKDEHAGHHPEGQAAGTPPSASDAQSAPTSEPSPVAAGMKRLQDLMTRIEAASDREERENLMHEHMLGLLQEVKLLRSQTTGMKMAMMGGGKQAGGSGGSMDAGEKDAGKPQKDKKGGG
jgi:hypothetical protein